MKTVMKHPVFYIIILAFIVEACGLLDKNESGVNFPNDTPFIFGAIEAANDSSQSMIPEVFVGYATYKRDFFRNYEGRIPERDDFSSLVVFKNTRSGSVANDLKLRVEENASVFLSQTIDGESQKVPLQFVPSGNFGTYRLQDKGFVQPFTEYTLTVVLPDGRTYEAKTLVPRVITPLNFTETVEVNLELIQNGSLLVERHVRQPGPELTNAAFFFNYESFDEPELVEKIVNIDGISNTPGIAGGELPLSLSKEGPFWAITGEYRIGLHQEGECSDHDFIFGTWYKDINEPLLESASVFTTVRMVSKEISNPWFYVPLVGLIVSCPDDGFWEIGERSQIRVNRDKDYSWFFEATNFRQVGENGELLDPLEYPVAGQFGSYSSFYWKTTMIPIRSWDPDTLNWPRN